MAPATKTPVTGVRIPPKVKAQICRVARRIGRSQQATILLLIERGILAETQGNKL